jgi:ATPase family associated with various cellular activities (AAA)
MIDCKAFRESNPSYAHSFNGLTLADLIPHPGLHHLSPHHHHHRLGLPTLTGAISPGSSVPLTIGASHTPKDIKTVPENELVLCAPTAFGYAFTEKAWVQMTVDGISPIVWDTEAFNKLVLPDNTKKLVKSLVQACRTDGKLIKDIISTKGSGVVFVLHGEPGTGKTLTAEAIGEELRRPILVIAVSDLGTDPTNVEIRLGNFLRTAEKWDSIVLLDEADIFLEQRARQDIFRNAMVGVFLRLLEYHNSPMFLTTNRVFSFDAAIRSRISIAIKYNPLKRLARKQVWRQLLEMANSKVSEAELNEISMSQVNGRYVLGFLLIVRFWLISLGRLRTQYGPLKR